MPKPSNITFFLADPPEQTAPLAIEKFLDPVFGATLTELVERAEKAQFSGSDAGQEILVAEVLLGLAAGLRLGRIRIL